MFVKSWTFSSERFAWVYDLSLTTNLRKSRLLNYLFSPKIEQIVLQYNPSLDIKENIRKYKKARDNLYLDQYDHMMERIDLKTDHYSPPNKPRGLTGFRQFWRDTHTLPDTRQMSPGPISGPEYCFNSKNLQTSSVSSNKPQTTENLHPLKITVKFITHIVKIFVKIIHS